MAELYTRQVKLSSRHFIFAPAKVPQQRLPVATERQLTPDFEESYTHLRACVTSIVLPKVIVAGALALGMLFRAAPPGQTAPPSLQGLQTISPSSA